MHLRWGRGPMRRLGAAVLVVVAMIATVSPAEAAESYRCWTEVKNDTVRGLPINVVVCRVSGSRLVEFDTPGAVPVVLHAAVGSTAGGECWYWRSVFTGWVIERLLGSRAVLRFEPPGGGALYDAVFSRCEGEPHDDPLPLSQVWEVIRRMRLPRPAAVIDPPVTVTGLPTYVVPSLPESLSETITSPMTGRTISVHVAVDGVTVHWGDGAEVSIGPGLFGRLDGHPSGVLRHVYEQRGVRTVVVGLDWVARWRVDAGPWHRLRLAPTRTILELRVDELIARRTG